jgi:hypothetical protein
VGEGVRWRRRWREGRRRSTCCCRARRRRQEEDSGGGAFRRRKATRFRPSRASSPVCGGLDGYSGGSGWIGLGKKPIPVLPNVFFVPLGEFVPAWDFFHSSWGFNLIPCQSLLTQTRP